MVLISLFSRLAAQSDTVQVQPSQPDSLASFNSQKPHLNYKSLIIPAAFISYGIASLTINDLKRVNFSTREEINEHQPDHIKLDNYTQYAPAVLVYGLNAAGIEGKHNFRDRTIIYATSQIISAAFTLPLKHLVKEERPDQSNNLSFPSGHTAAAFSSAQFMFREYKDTHFWLSLSGYPIAVFTGIYRMLNDKHWVGDVVAGAGFGILSTEFAYWLFPKINSMLGGKTKNRSTMIMPFYQDKSLGLGWVKTF
ncbi:PAP2 superfamily protein [Chryseobacterium shigense]|uniref:PAP2 superfamily protein n=1 Tax=Chryseobacterium shigense TaxID=297244 RepID=A0A1N7IFS9_9FLAO|nr:phosphatase PAP2 family protein [Chryseobacterium shigense]SIS35964.1 PAP2 superfamily protein [Chryseobacterium shigense]